MENFYANKKGEDFSEAKDCSDNIFATTSQSKISCNDSFTCTLFDNEEVHCEIEDNEEENEKHWL